MESFCHKLCHQLQLLLAFRTVPAARAVQQSRTNVWRTSQLILSFPCGLGSRAIGKVFIGIVPTLENRRGYRELLGDATLTEPVSYTHLTLPTTILV